MSIGYLGPSRDRRRASRLTCVITADDFRALSRSSPWRCTAAHVTRRGAGSPEVEAWLERPGRLTVRDAWGETHRWESNQDMSVTPDLVAAAFRMPERYADDALGARALAIRWVHHTTPITRDDGLVLVRPDDESWQAATGQPPQDVESADPMYDNYVWVAMLDPWELARGVELSRLRETTHHGRRAWAARCVPTEAYRPRCGCCELLWSEVSVWAEHAAGGPAPGHGDVYPEAYDVVLDHGTGFVVSLVPVGATSRHDLAFDLQVHAAE